MSATVSRNRCLPDRYHQFWAKAEQFASEMGCVVDDITNGTRETWAREARRLLVTAFHTYEKDAVANPDLFTIKEMANLLDCDEAAIGRLLHEPSAWEQMRAGALQYQEDRKNRRVGYSGARHKNLQKLKKLGFL